MGRDCAAACLFRLMRPHQGRHLPLPTTTAQFFRTGRKEGPRGHRIDSSPLASPTKTKAVPTERKSSVPVETVVVVDAGAGESTRPPRGSSRCSSETALLNWTTRDRDRAKGQGRPNTPSNPCEGGLGLTTERRGGRMLQSRPPTPM